MMYKIIATPNVVVSQSKKPEKPLTVEELAAILEKTGNESYPEPYYLRSLEQSVFSFLDDSAKRDLSEVLKAVGGLEIGGIYVYSSSKIELISKELSRYTSLTDYCDRILKTLVEGFPILAAKRLLDDTDVSYGIVESNGKMWWANQSALSVLGLSLYEVIGKSIQSVSYKYDFFTILANQILKRFEPYFLEWKHKNGERVPSIVEPGPIVNRMTYGTIIQLDRIFNGKYGKNIFADKNGELMRSIQAQKNILDWVSRIQKHYLDYQLKEAEVMCGVSDLLGAHQTFSVNLTLQSLMIMTKDSGGWKDVNSKNEASQSLNELTNYLRLNPWLHYAKELSHNKKLLAFLPDHEAIRLCLIVPISSDNKIKGWFGVSSHQNQLPDGVDLDLAHRVLTDAAVWLQLLARTKDV